MPTEPTTPSRPATPAQPERRWTCDERHPAGIHWDTVIRDDRGCPVASVYAAGWDRLATRQHAELIAAAPELLDGLHAALDMLDELVNRHYGGELPCDPSELNRLEASRAAIAKAEPRS